ncbi:LysR family transcriptional regulator [Chondromyces apiculatus]|uniref:Transcriptional regulator, LysR family n=1 Tax=Chondromyces apiculatus DSM 436 TaxID=1192034 RepID=A0A017TG81_9BACT|nr:LysR family transcriptional regulator [Chondromyces apiculatus]EYF08308.1 transcriptional regulator, LysR family [Chondromyces apiculatus DSM 436]
MPTFDPRLLNGIGVLVAVVEAGNFVRAAEALSMTQSGVSRAVARMEQRLGVRLFHRTARAVSLTEEGRRFYEDVAPLLAGMEDAATRASRSSAAVRGRLSVNVDASFGHYIVSQRIGGFLEAHPELSLDLLVRDRMGDLDADGIDVAVRFGEPEPSSLTCRLLLQSRVLTCASPEYIAKRGAPRHPRDLVDDGHECLLIRDPATGRHFAWEFHRGDEVVPVTVSGRLMVNDSTSLIGACLGGCGIAQPLESFVREMLADGRLVQLLPDWAEETFPLYAYHRSRNLPSAKVRAFLDYVVALTR